MNPMTRRWHLRTLLIWLLCTSSLVTFVVIGAVLFFVRVPQITAETRAELSADATDLAHRSEVILGALEAQLDMLAALMAAGALKARERAARTLADVYRKVGLLGAI